MSLVLNSLFMYASFFLLIIRQPYALKSSASFFYRPLFVLTFVNMTSFCASIITPKVFHFNFLFEHKTIDHSRLNNVMHDFLLHFNELRIENEFQSGDLLILTPFYPLF